MLLKSCAASEEGKRELGKEKIGDVFDRISTQLAEFSAILREMRSCCRSTDTSPTAFRSLFTKSKGAAL